MRSDVLLREEKNRLSREATVGIETLGGFVMKKLVKLAAIGAAAAVAATLGAIAPASAHGEKSQQAFLRMRTLNWYDVAWSKTTVNVNEEMILSGKVHVFSAWPQAVANPRVSFLNAGEPGPVLVRTAQFIGEQFAPRSVSLEIAQASGLRSRAT